MKALKVIENELVPVYETSTGEKVVYGTELHKALAVKSKFADWVKNRLNDCEAITNEDYEAFSKILENGGRIKEYIIKLDTAKEMAMLERNEKGKQVRRYFINVEKKYAEVKKKGISSSEAHELELKARAMRAEAMRLNARTRAFREIKDSIPRDQLSGIALKVFDLKGAEVLTGEDLGIYLPQAEKTYSATEVGNRLKITKNKVGKLANAYGLKTDEYGITVMDKSPYSSKEMPSFRYNEKAVEKLREILKQEEDL